jgi:hypothetical protein
MTTADHLGSRKARDCVGLLLALCVSLSCAASANDVHGSQGQAPRDSTRSDATVSYLNLSNRSITQAVEPNEVADARFVQVEVTEVVNRKKIPLSFEVRYQAKDNTRIYLGSFALYPADNPGKFIVATQGKVKGDGAIVLTMVISEKVDAEDVVKVGIKKIRLVKE